MKTVDLHSQPHRIAVLALLDVLRESRQAAEADHRPLLERDPTGERFVRKRRAAWTALYVLEDVLSAEEWEDVASLVETFRAAARMREDRARRIKIHRLPKDSA